MVIYVGLIKDNTCERYKSLNMAWIHPKIVIKLQKLIDKGYIYYKVYGKRGNIEYFTLMTNDFKSKVCENSTNIYKFLNLLTERFIYSNLESDFAIIISISDPYIHNTCDLKMVKLKIEFNNLNYNVTLQFRYLISLNYTLNSKIPVLRDDKTNNIRIDYNKINELLGLPTNKNYYML